MANHGAVNIVFMARLEVREAEEKVNQRSNCGVRITEFACVICGKNAQESVQGVRQQITSAAMVLEIGYFMVVWNSSDYLMDVTDLSISNKT